MCVQKKYKFACQRCRKPCTYTKGGPTLCDSAKKKNAVPGSCWRGLKEKWQDSKRTFCSHECKLRHEEWFRSVVKKDVERLDRQDRREAAKKKAKAEKGKKILGLF